MRRSTGVSKGHSQRGRIHEHAGLQQTIHKQTNAQTNNKKRTEQTTRTHVGASKLTDERHKTKEKQATSPVARLRLRGAWLPSPFSMGDSNNGPNRHRPDYCGHSPRLKKETNEHTNQRERKNNQNEIKTGKSPVAKAQTLRGLVAVSL